MSELQVKNEDRVQDEVVQMQQKLQEVQTQKEQIAQELLEVRQEHSLKEKLLAAGSVDAETAMLVVKSRLAQDDKADADKVIEQVRRDKPYLFETQTAATFPATRGAKDKVNAIAEKLRAAAAKAFRTAGRTELMEYMKTRRGR